MDAEQAKNRWECYYVEQIEEASTGWKSRRIIDMLSDAGTRDVEVLKRTRQTDRHLDFLVQAECADGPVCAQVRLYNKDLDEDLRDELQDFVALQFPKGVSGNHLIRQRVATAIGREARDEVKGISFKAS